MKKNLFILAALAGAALVGCNKNPDMPDFNKQRQLNSTVTIQIGTKGTKAVDANSLETEDKVNTLDVFIFNNDADRKLDAYAHAVAESAPGAGDGFVVNGTDRSELTYTVQSTSGPKTVVTVLNMPARMTPATVASLTDLEARVFDLRDNALAHAEAPTVRLDNFQMVGAKNVSLNPGSNDVAVDVDRVVARIRLKKISRDFESAALQGKAMSIDRIYVSNAVGSHMFTYNRTAAGSAFVHVPKVAGDAEWFYKYMNQDDWDIANQDYTSPDPSLYYAGYVDMYTADAAAWDPSVPSANKSALAMWLQKPIAQSLVNGASLTFLAAEQCYYVMPNSLTPNDDSDPTNIVANDDRGRTEDTPGHYAWTPRLSKIVIEATLDGKKVYYAIPLAMMAEYPSGQILAGLQSNYSYDIDEVVLTRPGSTDPDCPVELSDINFTITINPWNMQSIQTEAGKYVI